MGIDGRLYVSVGDTGSNANPPVNKYGACLNKANGKILRVNLDGTVPTDNPLASVAMATGCTTETKTTGDFNMAPPDRRIFAWGLVLAVAFGLLSGVYPAWRMSRVHPVIALKGTR